MGPWFHKGFTLIELMIVIGIISILSGIAVLNYMTALPNYKLHAAARDVSSLLRKARSTAIKERRAVIIEFKLSESGTRSDGCLIFDAKGRRRVFPECGSICTYYGNGVHFGFGDAKKGAALNSNALPKRPLSFQYDKAIFNADGTNWCGYVYLANSVDKACAVGAKGNGVISLKQWSGKDWK